MPKKRFSDEQIAFALMQAEAGTTVGEICRKMAEVGTLEKISQPAEALISSSVSGSQYWRQEVCNAR
jgi:hypothetical protein